MDGSFAPARTKVRPPCTPLGPQNIDLVRKFNDRSDVKIELRHYDVLPFGPVYIVDDTIYWGIYIANDDSMTGPQFVCSRRSPVGKMIEASLNAIWDSASPDNLEASLQPNAAIRAEE